MMTLKDGYRKIPGLITAILAVVVISGCSDLLDVTPRTSIAPSDMGEGEVEELLNGIYIQFQNGPGRYSFILFDLMGGNIKENERVAANNIYIAHQVQSTSAEVRNMWQGYYQGLYRTNTLLEVLDQLEPTPRNQEIRGIAHYFRGYAYYNLVTRYGGVPILRENTRDHVARDPESDVWDFIVEELEKAVDLAPGFGSEPDYFYVTSEAAKALLARTELSRGNMARAAQLAEEVIESGNFELEDDYERIFRGGSNSETVFAFANISAEHNNISALFTPHTMPQGGSYFLLPADDVVNELFTSDDTRKDMAFTFYQGTDLMVNKYISGFDGGDPVPVSRIAEMYLISAEAQGPAGIGRLNQLRAVRGLAPLDIDDEEEYSLAVATERRRELTYEGFRWYDLIRTGRALDELFFVNSEDQLRLPIPQRELDHNPLLVQNPGF